jgi:quinol monooxygenase YgiN
VTVVLYATFTALEGTEARVASLLEGLTENVRREPGNILFEPSTLRGQPRSFFVYEVYRDEAAFEAHLSAPYGAVFNGALAGLVEGGGSALTWLSPLLSQNGADN